MLFISEGSRLSPAVTSDRPSNLCPPDERPRRSGGRIVLYLCAIVGTRRLIRPLVPRLAALPSKHNKPVLLYLPLDHLTAPPRGPGSRSQAVGDHRRRGPFVHCSTGAPAASDKVWCCDTPGTGMLLSHLPPLHRLSCALPLQELFIATASPFIMFPPLDHLPLSCLYIPFFHRLLCFLSHLL